MYSQRFDHVLHISFSLFFYLRARLGCAMKKCQKKYDFHDKSLQHMVGCSNPSIWSSKKKKKLIKIFHFLLQSLSLSVSVPAVWRILSHDCWGELWFIYHVLLQLMTIAIITLIKTIAQGTHRSSLISNTCLFSCLQCHILSRSQQKTHRNDRFFFFFYNITLLLWPPVNPLATTRRFI